LAARKHTDPVDRRTIENLTGLLDRICALVACDKTPGGQKENVTLREVFAAIGRRTYGPLLLALGLFSVSPLTAVPGMTWASAGLTLIVAVQLMVGLPTPWLPKGLLESKVSSNGLVKAIEAIRPVARGIDVMLRPRLEFLAKLPLVIVIGALCVAAAAVTFPLGFIPLAPLAPGLAIVLFGLGLTARDGLVLSLGAATVVGAIVLAMRLINGLTLPAPFLSQ
jgi:hypothetical protein